MFDISEDSIISSLLEELVISVPVLDPRTLRYCQEATARPFFILVIKECFSDIEYQRNSFFFGVIVQESMLRILKSGYTYRYNIMLNIFMG